MNTGNLEPMIFRRNARRAHVDRHRNASRLTASDGTACTPAAEAEDAFPVAVFGEPPPPAPETVWLFEANDSLNEFIRSFGRI